MTYKSKHLTQAHHRIRKQKISSVLNIGGMKMFGALWSSFLKKMNS